MDSTRANSDLSSRPTSIGYGRQSIAQEDVEAIRRVLAADFLTQGPEVPRFEESLRRETGAPHAVCVTNGTCALELAYRALELGAGQRVLTTANTFLATATAALHTGAEVDFVDIESQSGNLDLDQVEEALEEGRQVDVLTVVHFAGLPCDMQRVIDLKRRFGFRLVEDAAHALGASYTVDGQLYRVGEHPEVDATCLSFHPVKLITTAEGGAVLTHDRGLAERLGRLRSHGIAATEDGSLPGWNMVELGHNYRLSDLHAALGRSQIQRLQGFLEERRRVARRYHKALAAEEGFEFLSAGDEGREHAWHLFVVRVPAEKRASLIEHLRARGISPQLHYASVVLQPWFRERYGTLELPRAESHSRTALSLPIYPLLGRQDQDRVIGALVEWKETEITPSPVSRRG